jgi:hypothetical protein
MLSGFAVGHNDVDGQAQVARPWPIPRNANPAGGVITEQGQKAPAFQRGRKGPPVLKNNQPVNAALRCASSLALGHHGVGYDPEKLPASAGGGVTTVNELLRYARFMMGAGTTVDGERFLSTAALDQIRTPQCAAGSRGSVGLAWFMEEIGGVRLIGHDGGTIGQIARLDFAPERQFALAILANASSGGELLRR